MKRSLMTVIAICIISAFASAQVHARKAIKGVWKVAEIVVTGTNAGAVKSPQPGLVIFGRKYYSMAYVRVTRNGRYMPVRRRRRRKRPLPLTPSS